MDSKISDGRQNFAIEKSTAERTIVAARDHNDVLVAGGASRVVRFAIVSSMRTLLAFDLAAATAFFAALGLELEGKATVEAARSIASSGSTESDRTSR